MVSHTSETRLSHRCRIRTAGVRTLTFALLSHSHCCLFRTVGIRTVNVGIRTVGFALVSFALLSFALLSGYPDMYTINTKNYWK